MSTERLANWLNHIGATKHDESNNREAHTEQDLFEKGSIAKVGTYTSTER